MYQKGLDLTEAVAAYACDCRHHGLVRQAGISQGLGVAEEVLTPQLFADVYGVKARVERCSQQTLQVLVDCPV